MPTTDNFTPLVLTVTPVSGAVSRQSLGTPPHSEKLVQFCPGTYLTAGVLNLAWARDPSDSLATPTDRSKQMY